MKPKSAFNRLIILGFMLITVAACNESDDASKRGEGLYATYECGGVTLEDAASVDELREVELLLDYRQFSADYKCDDQGDIHYFVAYKLIEFHEGLAKKLDKPLISALLAAAGTSAMAVEFCKQNACEVDMKDMQALRAYAHLLVGKEDLAKSSLDYLLANGWTPEDKTQLYPDLGQAYLFKLLEAGEYSEVESFLNNVAEENARDFSPVKIRLETLTAENLEHFYRHKVEGLEIDQLIGLCGGLSLRKSPALERECFQRILHSHTASEYARENARQKVAELKQSEH